MALSLAKSHAGTSLEQFGFNQLRRRRSQLGEAINATPAISNGRMFLRGFKKLYCLESK